MENAAHAAEALIAESHDDLRQPQGISRLQAPGEVVRVDAADQSSLFQLILLQLHQELSAVHEGEAIAGTGVFCGIWLTDHQEGAVLVAADAPDASH